MKKQITLVMLAVVALVTPSFASLLNVSLTYPEISANSASAFALNYTPTNHLLSISAAPTTVLFARGTAPKLISGTKNLQIQWPWTTPGH